MQTRRTFLRRGASTAGAAAVALGPAGAALGESGGGAGYGPLIDDPRGLIDLPRGFRYRVVQSVDGTLDNGAPVPSDFDGMTAVAGPHGSTVLVRDSDGFNRLIGITPKRADLRVRAQPPRRRRQRGQRERVLRPVLLGGRPDVLPQHPGPGPHLCDLGILPAPQRRRTASDGRRRAPPPLGTEDVR
jgi:uncharacterized protein DUF839